MSQKRDLGTAILNIKIAFETLNKEAIKKQLDLAMGLVDKSIQKATKAIKPKKSVSKAAETIGKELVVGIEKGIEQAAPQVEAKAKGIVNSFLSMFRKSAEIKSPSKKTMRLGQQMADGIIKGLQEGGPELQKAAATLVQAATPKIARKYLDQITNLNDELSALKGAWKSTSEAISQGLAPPTELVKIEQAIRNAAIALEILKAKAKKEPGLEIDRSTKDRVRDIERENAAQKKAQAELQKAAGGAKKLAQELKEIAQVYQNAGQDATKLGDLSKAAFNKAEKAFSGVVNTAKKLKNFDESEKMLLRMRAIAITDAKAIQDGDARKRVLEGVNRAYKQQLTTLKEIRSVEEAKPQQMRDKVAREIERQSTAIRKTRQSLKDLSAQYNATDKSASNLAGSAGAISEKLNTFFTKMVTGANKTKDFAQALIATQHAEQELSRQIVRAIKDTNLQTLAFTELREAAKKARIELQAKEDAYLKSQNTKRLNKEVRETLAGTGTADLTSLNNSLTKLKQIQNQMTALGVSSESAQIAITRLSAKIKNIQAGNLEKATKAVTSGQAPLLKTKQAIKEVSDAYDELGNASSKLVPASQTIEQLTQKLFSRFLKKAKATGDSTTALQELYRNYVALVRMLPRAVKDTNLLAKATSAAGKAYNDAVEEIKAFQEKLDKAEATRVVDNKIKDVKTKIPGASSKELEEYKKSLEGMVPAANAMGVSTVKLTREIAKLDTAIKNAKRREFKTFILNTKQAFQQLGSSISQTGEQIRRVSFILRDIGRQMMTISRTMFRSAKPVLDDYIKFEQAVTDVLAVTGDLNSNLTKTDIVATDLGQTILGLAGKFVFSAEEIANVSKELALAGFSLDQITASLESVITLAAATGSDLSTSGKIITSAMAVFGLQADQTSRVADVFTAAVTGAKTNLNQLSEAFKIAAPVAAMSGQSIEQTAAALGLLANAGMTGTMAGTGLSRILSQITEKAGKLEGILRPLGSSFAAIDPERNNFSDIVAEFERLNLSSATLREIFDLRAFRALNATLAQGADRLSTFNEQLERSDRIAQAISSARLNTLAGEIQLLSDAFTSLKISLGDVVGEEIRQIVMFLKDLVVVTKDFIATNKEAVAGFVRFAAAAATVIGSLGTSLFTAGSGAAFFAAPLIALGAVLATFNSLATFTTGLLFSFGVAISTAAAIAAGVVATLSGVFFAASGAAISFFAAVSVSIAAFTNKWGAFVLKVGELFSNLYYTILVPIYNGFVANLGVVEQATDRFIASLLRMGQVVGGTLANGSWENFGALLADLVAALLDFASIAVTDITPALKDIAESLKLLLTESNSELSILMTNFKRLYDLGKLLQPVFHSLLVWQLPHVFLPQIVGDMFTDLRDMFLGNGGDPADEDAPEQTAVTERFNEQAKAMGNVITVANLYSKELGKVAAVLKNLSSTKPVQFEQLANMDENILDSRGRQEVLGNIKKKIEELSALKKELDDKLAAGQPLTSDDAKTRGELEKRIAELQKSESIVREIGGQVDKLNKFLYSNVDTNTKNIVEAIKSEQANLKQLDGIIDTITKMQINRAGMAEPAIADIKRVAEQLGKLGITVDISGENPLQNLVAAISGQIKQAKDKGMAELGQLKDLLKVLPEISGLNLNDPEAWRKVAEAFDRIVRDADEVSLKLEDTYRKREEIAREMAKFGKSEHELRMEEIEEEKKARIGVIEEEIRLLGLREGLLDNEIREATATGEDTTSMRQEKGQIANRLRFLNILRQGAEFQARQKREEELGKEMANEQEAREKAVKEDADVRMKAEEDILKNRLEVEEDVQERINIRQLLAQRERAKQLEATIDDLRDKTLDAAEFAKLERELRAASAAAGDKEALEIAEDELGKGNKDMVQTVDKRLDLEVEMVSQMAKQVKTMADLIQLTRFLEILQKRKDRDALKAVHELNKEREKLARFEARFAAGDKLIDANKLQAQRDIVALLAGKVANRKRQAGADGGNPGNIFNLDAMIAGLDAALANFVKKLQDNPIIIPARFDMKMLKEDLTKLLKQFNMDPDKLAAQAPRRNPALDGALANRGGVMTHNDNRVVNINVARADSGLENMVGRMFNA